MFCLGLCDSNISGSKMVKVIKKVFVFFRLDVEDLGKVLGVMEL